MQNIEMTLIPGKRHKQAVQGTKQQRNALNIDKSNYCFVCRIQSPHFEDYGLM